jgi:hypothetical protein
MSDSYYDVQQNEGGGSLFVRTAVKNNPARTALAFSPSDFGLLGWTCQPEDVSVLTTAAVSGTQYFARMSIPFNTGLQLGNSISNIGLYCGSTAAVTAGTFAGMALYQLVGTNLVLVESTGNIGAAWATAAPASKMFLPALTADANISPGVYFGSFIADFTTEPTFWTKTLVAGAININNELGVSGTGIAASYTVTGKTSFGSTIALSTLTASTALPLMGIAA